MAKGTIRSFSDPRFVARFWRKVRKVNDCWEWQGALFDNGYGQCWFLGKRLYAHRVAYELANRKQPGDLIVRHKCDNPPCVNPRHLLIGTQADNMADMHERGRGDTSGLIPGGPQNRPKNGG